MNRLVSLLQENLDSDDGIAVPIGGWFLVVVLRKRLKVSSRITPPVIEDYTSVLSRRLGVSWSVSVFEKVPARSSYGP